MSVLQVNWIDAGREPQCPPDPHFPQGVDVDISRNAARTCFRLLPYPAKRCGQYIVTCSTCGFCTIVTTAGRIDDPRSIKVACKTHRLTIKV